MQPAPPQLSQPLLPLPPGCRTALFLGREKRFTMRLRDPATGEVFAAHTNNTGSMLGLLRPGFEVRLSPAQSPGRKLAWTVEQIRVPGPPHAPERGFWVGVNTASPNRMLQAAWQADALPEFKGYVNFRREAVCGESRLDALLTPAESGAELWVECKNVTLVEDEVALFPDAASPRGCKHLETLTRLVREGRRAALFFLVQRPDARCFAPAAVVDPQYARLYAEALAAGVEAWPWVARVTAAGLHLERRLPLAG